MSIHFSLSLYALFLPHTSPSTAHPSSVTVATLESASLSLKSTVSQCKTYNRSIDSCTILYLTQGMMSSGTRDPSAAGPPSVWIWICLPDMRSQSVQHKSHLAGRMVSLLWGWSTLYTVISFKLYLAESAKPALLSCHFITHSLAVCAHGAPGSWSTAVSLLHLQRSSFLTRTGIQGKYKKEITWGQ